ncbi:DUF3047 domain-containing protein [Desulfurivibrio sp. D14AmB]|uniref:DUF3047 domain-containing protein n=1 Tax=Desulfurivibrio sp. D14AmB TaxID=3374370 RepID=UPI00376F3FB6
MKGNIFGKWWLVVLFFGAILGSGWPEGVWADSGVAVRVDFADLEDWRPLTFPKIPRHSDYRIVELEEGRRVLRVEADKSASGLVHRQKFDPMVHNVLRWRWRVENVYRQGDATRKDGDDYPLRVYVLFAYDPQRASLGMRATYRIARLLYGEYPPHASLNYIWANREQERRILANPYTDRAVMVIVRWGENELGRWLTEEVDILADYRAAFGEDPPREARLAIMGDADNTGESAVAYLEFIELR